MYVTFGQNEASNLNPTSTFHNTSVSSSNSLKIVTSPYSLSPFTLNMWRNWGWGPFPVPCLCGNWQDPSNLLDYCSSLNSSFHHTSSTDKLSFILSSKNIWLVGTFVYHSLEKLNQSLFNMYLYYVDICTPDIWAPRPSVVIKVYIYTYVHIHIYIYIYACIISVYYQNSKKCFKSTFLIIKYHND